MAEDVMPILTIGEYKEVLARLSVLVDKAEHIAEVINKGTFVRFEMDEVVYEYNDGCHCHPEYTHGRFPSEYLFDPLWESKWEAEKAAEAQRKLEQEEAAEKRRKQAEEKKEREAYERLKARFESKNA